MIEPRDLLRAASGGDGDASRTLTEHTYDELRGLAVSYLRRERCAHTLQPTALVHEAMLKMFRDERLAQHERSTWLAIAARAMRQVLIDHAHRRNAKKRGGESERVTLSFVTPEEPPISSIDVLDLRDSLERLEAINGDYLRIVEMRFFSGMSVDEIAAALDVSSRTVKRMWRGARAWLSADLGPRIETNS